jgi:hypothetical protein
MGTAAAVVLGAILAWFGGPSLIESAAKQAIGTKLVEEAKSNAAEIEELRDDSERYAEKSLAFLKSLQPPYEQLASHVMGSLTKNKEFRKSLEGAPGPKGDKGPQGVTGPQGPKGDSAPEGPSGVQILNDSAPLSRPNVSGGELGPSD